MKRTSNVLVAIGALAFVIGAGLVVGALRGNGSSGSGVPSGVLVARAAIPAGTTGEDLVAHKLVVSRKVASNVRSSDAVSSVAQLTGRVIAVDIAPGEQVRTSQLRQPALRAATITVTADLTVSRRDWLRHPHCGCAWG